MNLKGEIVSAPLITVYIPTYQRIDLLRRSVASVLCQNYDNYELLVIDDGSDDGTIEYLSQLEKNDSRVKVLDKDGPKGAPFSRNMAIKSANGLFVTGLDDDDFFLPNRLSGFVEAWSNKAEHVIGLYTSHAAIGRDGQLKLYDRPPTAQRNRHFLRNAIGNQVFTLTENLRLIGGFDENLGVWQDLECWVRLMELGEVQRVNNNSYVFDHSHDSQRISDSKKEIIEYAYQHISEKHSLKSRDLRRFTTLKNIYIGDLGISNLYSHLSHMDLFGVYISVKNMLKSSR
jgi:glycosyltransferase involved in cell wall biosynthesis